jgi:hypothetical protein
LPGAPPAPERKGKPEGFDPRATHLDVVAGLPLGLRLQTPILRGAESALAAEAFGGLYLIFPMAGAGLRYHHSVSLGGRDFLTIGPGCGVHWLHNTFSSGGGWFGGGPSGWTLVGADVDLVCRRSAESGSEGYFGLKLGGAARSGSPSLVLPIVGVFGGWQF